MRFLVQRVSEANVMVDNNITGKIGKGYLVLIGITHTDTTDDADYLINKLIKLMVNFYLFHNSLYMLILLMETGLIF